MDQVKKLCDELEISLALGSQDIDMLSGARTGSISIDMLCDIGGSFSILGHSERRIIFNEKSSSIKQKIIKLEDQAFSILCIGETLEENKSDKAKFIDFPALIISVRKSFLLSNTLTLYPLLII